jgi:hypothetical protein
MVQFWCVLYAYQYLGIPTPGTGTFSLKWNTRASKIKVQIEKLLNYYLTKTLQSIFQFYFLKKKRNVIFFFLTKKRNVIMTYKYSTLHKSIIVISILNEKCYYNTQLFTNTLHKGINNVIHIQALYFRLRLLEAC